MGLIPGGNAHMNQPMPKILLAEDDGDMRRFLVEGERGLFLDELRAIWEHASFLPRIRTTAAAVNLKALRDAQFDSNAGLVRKALRRSHTLLDRHLLWRLRPRQMRQ